MDTPLTDYMWILPFCAETQSQTLGSCVQVQSFESTVEDTKDSENAASASACTSPSRNIETGSTVALHSTGVGGGKDGQPSCSVDQTDVRQRTGSASPEGLQLENHPVVEAS